MVRHQGIDVYLAPFSDINNRFREYPVPATYPKFTNGASEAYVEAVDGERFVVVVDLGEEYEAKGSARLWIECFIDGGFISKQVSPYVQLKEAVPRESALRGRYINERTDLHIAGQLVRCGYKLSPLRMGTLLFLLPIHKSLEYCLSRMRI
jgi:hypothetical protein